MFEWQKKQIKKLNIEKDTLEAELEVILKMKAQLESLDNIKEYIRLLEDKNVKEYITLSKSQQTKEEAINEKNNTLQKLHQDICYHQNLYFISDETINHQDNFDCQYFRCKCLDCGYINDFIFHNGKRENVKLIYPQKNQNKLILKK